MTYSILSLDSGNVLESYETERRALEAVARIRGQEPVAADAVAVVTFDDAGMPVDSIDGIALLERLREYDRVAAH